jgi:acyl-CoA reductase-like NAD-dependent aldehyde dehydrogenase
MVVAQMKAWKLADPRAVADGETQVVSPLMVHAAATVSSIQEGAHASGVRVLLGGGRVTGSAYADNAEVAAPVVLGRVKPGTRVPVDWDGQPREIDLATTEFFMPILVTMEVAGIEPFIRFCLEENPHDLATSLWTRDDVKLSLARRTLAGMLKENDGTDSALVWEEFGASGVGESGNTGVGDAETTIAMFCRRQKGRHFVL